MFYLIQGSRATLNTPVQYVYTVLPRLFGVSDVYKLEMNLVKTLCEGRSKGYCPLPKWP